MLVETLSAELERLFELDELSRLSRDALGFEPAELGSTTAKASFARALAQRAIETEAVEALLDTVKLWRRGLPPGLDALRTNGLALATLRTGDAIGDYTVLSVLGSGPWATVYKARRDGREFRLKCLRTSVARRRSDAQRYFAATRLAAQVTHAGLPTHVQAGNLDAAGSVVGVSQDAVEGESLATLLRKSPARHFNELLPLLWAIGEALAALHEANLVHGAVHTGNVLVVDPTPTAPQIVLLDAGSHLLRPELSAGHGTQPPAWLLAASPEQLRGEPLDARSDLYNLGVLIYELMSGKPPFAGANPIDALIGHLTASPAPLSFVAAGHGATPAVEAFVQSLLEKRREQRPRDANEALEGLRRIWRASTRPPSWVSDERLPELFAALAQNPADEDAAASLEASVDLGADAERLAAGFYDVAVELRGRREPVVARAMKKLLARSARLYDAAGQSEAAEQVYVELLAFDPRDPGAIEALTRIKRKQGKYEELIESLLEQSEAAETPHERAQYLAEIGELYESELKDKDQALIAYAQAVCEDPQNDAHVAAVDRLAGTRYQAWEDVLGRAVEAASSPELPAERRALLFHMGRWYVEKVARPDLALPWLTRLVALEPNHDRALALLAQIFKKAQQWPEYGQTLLRRADIAAPNLSRDLRAEAAQVLAVRMSDPAAAREIYLAILEEDPLHMRAAEGLILLLEATGEYGPALRVRETRAKTFTGDDRHQELCDIAQGYEVHLDKLDSAEQHYREVLKENPKHMEALRGLDRVLTRAGRYRELLEVLRSQAELGVTARQKIAVYERIASIYDEEYLDHERAADALETVLELDLTRANTARELARHYRALGRYADLAELYQRQSGAGDVAQRVETQLLLGKVLREQLKQPALAIHAYEAVLELVPSHSEALDALATLRAVVGDAESAILAIDELAEKAVSPAAEAEQHERAAALLEAQDNREGALMRYRRALELCPDDPARRAQLRKKYTEFGNHRAAIELIEEELEQSSSARERGALAGSLASLYLRHLQDTERAVAAAQLALNADTSNADALRVLGRTAHADKRYVEAAKRLEPVATQLDGLEPEEAREIAFLYVDALARAGSADKALATASNLMRWLSDEPSSLLGVLEIAHEHGSGEQSLFIAEQVLSTVRSLLSPAEEAQAELRMGEALTKLARFAEACAALERSAELDPYSTTAFRALAKAHAAAGDHRKHIDTLYRELELSDGDRRVEILLEMGDLATRELADADYAAKSYLLALSERPNDRTILTKLMQLYGAEKDWPKLIEVIKKLAEVVAEPKHKAKYLHTASMIASRELADLELAANLVGSALEHDPDLEPALDEALTLRQRLQDHEGVKDALKLKVAHAERAGNRAALLELLPELADVYARLLDRRDQAVAVYESLIELDPDNLRFLERLARLHAEDPARSFERAVHALGVWIDRDPYQPEAHKLLRQVYTAARHADAAWCTCQALRALGQADSDEARFFERMRTGEPASIGHAMSPEEWLSLLMPEDFDPYLTELFGLIQPFVVGSRSRPLSAFGLSAEHQISTESYPYGVVLAVAYAAQAFGMAEPRMYQNPEAPSGVSFLVTAPPCLMLGARAFGEDVTPIAAAFLAGRHLAYYLPGLYVRQLLSNVTALKAWLFAAIRLVRDKFPVGPELEGPVAEASEALIELASGARLEQLTQIVAKLLAEGASLDLKRWVHSVDFAADAGGFVLSDDLETAIERVGSLPQDAGSPPLATRVERLIAYSVSSRYMALRERLGLRIDSE